jgi:hypothetical protein
MMIHLIKFYAVGHCITFGGIRSINTFEEAVSFRPLLYRVAMLMAAMAY